MWISTLMLLIVVGVSNKARATFQNMGFESAQVPAVPPNEFGGFASTALALPGWQVFGQSISVPPDHVLHNNYALGSSAIGLFGPHWEPDLFIEGNYSVLLQAGVDYNQMPSNVGLFQTGIVPAGTESIRLLADGFFFPVGPFTVELNAQLIPMVPISQTPDYIMFAGDASAFAGLLAELKITAISVIPDGDYNTTMIDSISFSPVPVPEPSSTVLLIAGSIACLAGRLRKRSK